MNYTNVRPWTVATAANLVQADGTDLFKMVVPTGYKPFVLHGISVVVTVAAGDTTSANLEVRKTPSGGADTLLKATTGVGISAAAGTTTYDATPSITGMTNEFYPGDTLVVEIGTTATTTGTGMITLWVADGPPA